MNDRKKRVIKAIKKFIIELCSIQGVRFSAYKSCWVYKY